MINPDVDDVDIPKSSAHVIWKYRVWRSEDKFHHDHKCQSFFVQKHLMLGSFNFDHIHMANHGHQRSKCSTPHPFTCPSLRARTLPNDSACMVGLSSCKQKNLHNDDFPQIKLPSGFFVYLLNPSEKHESIGMMTFPIYGKIKVMFQTTNLP